jgi:hypothetical protein
MIDNAMDGVAGQWYTNEAAAVDAVKGAGLNKIQTLFNIEIGVSLIREVGIGPGGATFVGRGVTQFLGSEVNPVSGNTFVPAGYGSKYEPAGYLHTHPPMDNNPSPRDLMYARGAVRGNAYVLQSGGGVSMYDYHAHKAYSEASGCGRGFCGSSGQFMRQVQ